VKKTQSEVSNLSNNMMLAVAGAALTLFCLLTIWVKLGNPAEFNQAVYQIIEPLINPILTAITIGVSILSEGYIWLLIAIGLMAYPKTRHKIGYLAVGVMLSASVLAPILKHLLAVPRPAVEQLMTVYSYGFPSGHATRSTAFIVVILFWLWQSHLSQMVKILATTGGVLGLLFIGFSRVYLGVHNTTDVIGGYLIGVFVATAVIYVIMRLSRRG
jgi:undecaprenyl-diphosphatase